MTPAIKGDISQPGLCQRACRPSSHPCTACHRVPDNSESGVIPVPPRVPFAHPRGVSGSLLINPSCPITTRMTPRDTHPPSRLPHFPRDFFYFLFLPGGHRLIATQHPNAASPANSVPWPSASPYSNSRLGQSTEPCGEQVGVSGCGGAGTSPRIFREAGRLPALSAFALKLLQPPEQSLAHR